MNVQEYVAQATERAGSDLAHHLRKTEADRRDWKPQVEGAAPLRSALDQVGECIHVNRLFAARFRGETPTTNVSPLTDPRPFATADEAMELIVESATECAQAIRGLSDEVLAQTMMTRRGSTPTSEAIMIPLRNMHYHVGQINLLQLLHGDAS